MAIDLMLGSTANCATEEKQMRVRSTCTGDHRTASCTDRAAAVFSLVAGPWPVLITLASAFYRSALPVQQAEEEVAVAGSSETVGGEVTQHCGSVSRS